MVGELIEKPVGKHFPQAAHIAVAGEFIQVSMHSHEAESDGAGRMKIFGRRQGPVEKGGAHGQVPRIVEESNSFAKTPKRPAVCILGPDLLHPLPGIGHEIAKAPHLFVIGIQKKSEVMTAKGFKTPAVGREVTLPHGGRQ